MSGKLTLFPGKNGEFRFNLKATNGQAILQSEGYKDKFGRGTASPR